MKKKRVLLLITNLGKGGAQRVFYDHARMFCERYEVEEAVFDSGQDIRIYNGGLPLHDLKRNTILFMFGPFGRLLGRAITLRKLVSERHFDLVISHMDGANWVNVLSGSKACKLLVVHGTVLYDKKISKFLQWLRLHLIFPMLYNRAAATVAVSAGIANELAMKCKVRNARVINNSFEVQTIKKNASLPIGNSLNCAFSRGSVLITSGRLAKQKKQSFLIDLLAILLKQGIDTRLVILGDGELREHLLHKCQDLQLRTYQVWDTSLTCNEDYDVYFFGYVSNPYKYLARSSLFLFPSAWEGFPLAICEAMIVGLPVLSSDCPTGPREILAPNSRRNLYNLQIAEKTDNGILLPIIETAKDLDVWATTVKTLLNDPVLCRHLAENAVKAIQALDRNVIAQQWYDLVDSVLLKNM